MSRRKQIRWEKDRPIFLKVGLILSLSLVIAAFNWTVEPTERIRPADDYFPPAEIEVVRTPARKEKLPPPPLPKSSRIIMPEPAPQPAINPSPYPYPDPVPVNPEPVISRPDPLPLPVYKEEVEDVPLLFAEVMPRFPGCEDLPEEQERIACSDQKMLEYTYTHIRYPPVARENQIEGMVIVRFVVEKDGSLSSIEVVRDIGGGCGAEVVRAVESMPHWIPGRQQGLPVRVTFNLPVRFQLQ